jgi:glycine cleavage system P protein (glycine dehydrogenase)
MDRLGEATLESRRLAASPKGKTPYSQLAGRWRSSQVQRQRGNDNRNDESPEVPMRNRPSLEQLQDHGEFSRRHIGPAHTEQAAILQTLGVGSIDALLDAAVPESIRRRAPLDLPAGRTEREVLGELRELAGKNRVLTSLIGMGYHGTITPPVILRNLLENPAWYTAYTPYQPEISQGRLEALLNFQTMVADLTGMALANASLLDEATAAAEAMAMCRRLSKSSSDVFVVHPDTHPQTIAVLRTRAEPVGIELVLGEIADTDACFGALLSVPGSGGSLHPMDDFAAVVHSRGGLAVVAADLLALVLLSPPGHHGADVVVGSAQRFGVPMGFGGPHAAFLATREEFARALPGRLVGVSTDGAGRPALRLALQTREQHIRREKATSNICTAQVLLANIAGMYAVWHGPDGLRRIAERVHRLASIFAAGLRTGGFELANDTWFDTLQVLAPGRAAEIVRSAAEAGINLRSVSPDVVGISFHETSTPPVVEAVWGAFGVTGQTVDDHLEAPEGLPDEWRRTDDVLSHPVFNRYHSEHEMLRYLRRLADRDLALDRTMIPLGSCTMKLNAAAEMIPITWPELANVHPYAPADQVEGYCEIIMQLEQMLVAITGYDAVSLQPNAGSQGELSGLLAIRAYHRSRGDEQRTVCLIPASAHGTNAASAVMAGLNVVVVACDEAGNVDLTDLRARADAAGDRLAAAMVTYPSTHGVFEEGITELCEIVHEHGGQVYVDGANLNALVGVAQPGRFGADVSHLNLHKTFCIPHGGGGPGVGPVAVRGHLVPFLPGHPLGGADQPVGPVAAAPFGSAGILPISWVYIALMGADGLRQATAVAIANANYIARRLHGHFPVLYTGRASFVAHECILDLRPITKATGVTVEDVAKRLIDYGFHAPTMSFPVAGTLMVEPTESESQRELDRFCDAMIAIRGEIDRVASGEWSAAESPLRHAPHTAEEVAVDEWDRPYPRELAAFPLDALRVTKYFPPVGRIDAAHGDRHLICSCPPVEEYVTADA